MGRAGDLWFLSANSWQQLSPNGSAPSARQHHQMAWSDASDGFYVFGGLLSGSGAQILVHSEELPYSYSSRNQWCHGECAAFLIHFFHDTGYNRVF